MPGLDETYVTYATTPFMDGETRTAFYTNTQTDFMRNVLASQPITCGTDCSGFSAHISRYVTEDQLENFSKKIYKIITEHVKLDISEDEFINLLVRE